MSQLYHNLMNSSVFILQLVFYINCCHEIHLDVTTNTFQLSITWFGLGATVSSIKCFHDRTKKKTISRKNLVRVLTEDGFVLMLHPTIRGQQSWSDVCSLSSCIYRSMLTSALFLLNTLVLFDFFLLEILLFLHRLLLVCCRKMLLCDILYNKDTAVLAFMLFVSVAFHLPYPWWMDNKQIVFVF